MVVTRAQARALEQQQQVNNQQQAAEAPAKTEEEVKVENVAIDTIANANNAEEANKAVETKSLYTRVVEV